MPFGHGRGTEAMYDARAPMRYPLSLILLSLAPACAFLAKSPAVRSPLHEQLAKAGGTRIEDAAKTCLARGGWKPDDVGGFAEGATVVSAKNSAKERVSVYIQPPEMNPRVTGGPGYDDPFWGCLSRELTAPTVASPEASSASPE
jgi:hypothetical protein